jgi:NAD-specific glutamate dehydrogenase
LREKFPEQIRQHRLRGEIIATDLANRIVNRMGMVLPFELAEEEGAGDLVEADARRSGTRWTKARCPRISG